MIKKVKALCKCKLYVKWKNYDNFFNSWIDKKEAVILNYFPESFNHNKNKVKVELDLSIYIKFV